MDGRIHFGTVREKPGGVARNICEALVKLDITPKFLTALGDDESGGALLQSLSALGIGATRTPGVKTAQCILVHDNKGDCLFLLGDMEAHRRITAKMIEEEEERIAGTSLMVLDGNLSVEALDAALRLAEKYGVPAFFEPTDVPVSSRPFLTENWKSLKYITPNLNELKAIASTLNIPALQEASAIDEAATIAEALADHIDNVIVTLGVEGVVIARSGYADDPLYKYTKREGVQVRHYPALLTKNVVNVSGAGDCFVAGLISGMLDGLSEERCIAVGMQCATKAVECSDLVPRDFEEKRGGLWGCKVAHVSLK